METNLELYNALINSVAHELRTPLTSITAVMETLSESRETLNGDIQQEMMELALGEAKRINRLIDNLLTDVRLSAGVISLQKEVHMLSSIVMRATSHFQAISLEIEPELPLAMLDAALIERVVFNLTQHSLQRAPKDAINIRLFALDQEIILEITDSGRAIPAGHEELVFTDFYPVMHGTSGELGIALSLTRKIIEAHYGRVWAENRPDEKVCFYFALPAMEEVLPELP